MKDQDDQSAAPAPKDLATLLRDRYQGYAYSYPHKSAYAPFPTPIALRELWAGEDLARIFLYIHLPFCEMRCGFCNLFTTANPKRAFVRQFLDALQREADVVADQLGDVQAAQFAIGGGTPTYLEPEDLAMVLDTASRHFKADPRRIPTSIETSPKTATPERLALLVGRGAERVSIGVQSFIASETRAMGRPQSTAELERALTNIRDARAPRLNVDLIYGAANQTESTWRESLRRALDWSPEEIFLYPLYVRPRTGLDGRSVVWDEHRTKLYRVGRDFLCSNGYRQISMRRFERSALPSASSDYGCQEDGMLGLGAGARSYTRAVHYSSDYAVSRRGVLSVINRYSGQTDQSFLWANHGVMLSEEERRRRYILKSVLRVDGLDLQRFQELFGISAFDAAPELSTLSACGAFFESRERLSPTAHGLEWSDAIGPFLYSASTRRRFEGFIPA